MRVSCAFGLNMLKYSRSSMRFGRLTYTFRIIRKTWPCNVYPLEPHFYILNLGYAGVYIFFLFFLQKRLWVLVRTASPTIYVLSKNKIYIYIYINLLKIFIFCNFNNLCILQGQVFVMGLTRVEHASNAFGERFRHTSVRYMRVPIS